MTIETPEIDLSAVPKETVKELYRQGEICLQGTVQLAIAADQRATTTSGILGAASIALMVSGASMILSPSSRPALTGAVFGVAFTLLIAAILCATAARSIDYFVAGYEPKLLAQAAGDETWMLRFATEDVQLRINHNRQTLERSSKLFGLGRTAALVAVPIGALVFLIIFAASAGSSTYRFF